MSEPVATPGTAQVSDLRRAPRGVVPRGFQTWLMVGLAVGIVLIILLTGQREPPKPTVATSAASAAPNPDRLRDYQERLRAMEARQALEAQAGATAPAAPIDPRYGEPAAPPPEDPIATDRKRREYESLFASNVVSSRRLEAERLNPDAAGAPTRAATDASLDEIAAAVVRAAGGTAPATQTVAVGSSPSPQAGQEVSERRGAERRTQDQTGPLSATGPLHTLLEGTVIDTVLTNRLDGNGVAPVNCLVTNPIYSHGGQQIVIPAGARILGETRPVQALGETRLAVGFHRLLMPDGSTQRLDQFLGLNQIGDAGLRDKVNHHFLATFGAAAAVGLISGLAQWVGTAGLTQGSGDRTVVIAGGAADSASQASLQVMNRFLNRLPTITIREGHRVKVYLTSDLRLPAYQPAALAAPIRR